MRRRVKSSPRRTALPLIPGRGPRPGNPVDGGFLSPCCCPPAARFVRLHAACVCRLQQRPPLRPRGSVADLSSALTSKTGANYLSDWSYLQIIARIHRNEFVQSNDLSSSLLFSFVFNGNRCIRWRHSSTDALSTGERRNIRGHFLIGHPTLASGRPSVWRSKRSWGGLRFKWPTPGRPFKALRGPMRFRRLELGLFLRIAEAAR